MATLPKNLPSASVLTRTRPAKTLSAVPRKTSVSRVLKREPIAAAKAKTHFLQLLDQVERDRLPITITKRGRPVAQLTPAPVDSAESPLESMIGRLKGKMKITGDIVSPDHDFWGPDWR